METLEKFDFSARGGGSTKYDFDKLFDGGIYRLTRGDDFDEKSSIKSIRGYMHTKASRLGKSLRTQADGNDAFVIQASPKANKQTRRRRTPKKPAAAAAQHQGVLREER